MEFLDKIGDNQANDLVSDVGPSSKEKNWNRLMKISGNGKLTLRYRGWDYLEGPQTHPGASQSDCYG